MSVGKMWDIFDSDMEKHEQVSNNTIGIKTKNNKSSEQRRSNGEIVDWEKERKFGKEGGTAELVVSDNFAVLASDQNTAIGIGDNSIILNGRTHISVPPSQIRINGLWVLNEELLTCIPSTLFNPVQTLLYKPPPYASKASKLIKLISSFTG